MLFRKKMLLFLLSLITIAVFYNLYVISLWHDIENTIRLAGGIVLLLSAIILLIITLRAKWENFLGWTLLFLFKLGYLTLLVFVAFNVHMIYSALFQISTDKALYSSSLVTIDSTAETVDEIGTGKIGVFSDEESVAGYIIPKEVIEKKNLENEIVYIDSYYNMLQKMADGVIDYAFLPTDYENMFAEIEALKEIIAESRIIHTAEKEVAERREGRTFNIEEPMTFLLMGVDSYGEDVRQGSFNGDALIVVTFDPQTMRVTMLSIPRDSYVPITCFAGERKNKITHAAWYGEDCVAATVENFLDIEIDYTVKMNFRGLVKLVDVLDGIEVDVPYSFCEQDSQRRWGEHTVYVKEGKQTLDGEQALALTRNRKNNTYRCGYGVDWANDFVRGQNQQLVLRAVMEELKEVRDLGTIQDLLEELGNTFNTNLQTTEILSFYNIFRDAIVDRYITSFEELVFIQRLYLSGYDQNIYDYHQPTGHGVRSVLYNFIPYQGSVDDVVTEMHVNLGLQERDEKRLMAFNVNEPYEETVIGRGTYQEERMAVLPSFVGYSKQEIINYANNHNLSYEFETVEHQGEFTSGQMIEQYPNPQTDLEYVNKIEIKIAGEYEESSEPAEIDCSQEAGLAECKFPDLIGKPYEDLATTKAKYQLDWDIREIASDDPDYDKQQAGKITEQSVTSGTDIYELYDETIVVHYMVEKDDEEEKDEDENDEEEEETE